MLLFLASVTVLQWLVVSNLFLLSVFFMGALWLRRQYQRDLQDQGRRTQTLQQHIDAMNKSALGLSRQFRQLAKRVSECEANPSADNDEALYHQAQRLVGMGASVDDLVSSCGVARAEAELLVSMQRQVAH